MKNLNQIFIGLFLSFFALNVNAQEKSKHYSSFAENIKAPGYFKLLYAPNPEPTLGSGNSNGNLDQSHKPGLEFTLVKFGKYVSLASGAYATIPNIGNSISDSDLLEDGVQIDVPAYLGSEYNLGHIGFQAQVGGAYSTLITGDNLIQDGTEATTNPEGHFGLHAGLFGTVRTGKNGKGLGITGGWSNTNGVAFGIEF